LHGNAVKGFWALWDNIHDCVFTTFAFPVILDGKFTSIQIIKCLGIPILEHSFTAENIEINMSGALLKDKFKC
jgi:hypothetical protein